MVPTTEQIKYWEGLCRIIASDYYAPGLDRDDLMQEARIGAFKALRDFREGRGDLGAFVKMCAQRQVITAVKAATRGKHSPLNYSARVVIDEDGERRDVIELIEADEMSSPLTALERREEEAGLPSARPPRTGTVPRRRQIGEPRTATRTCARRCSTSWRVPSTE